jgi:hypothetical protein
MERPVINIIFFFILGSSIMVDVFEEYIISSISDYISLDIFKTVADRDINKSRIFIEKLELSISRKIEVGITSQGN